MCGTRRSTPGDRYAGMQYATPVQQVRLGDDRVVDALSIRTLGTRRARSVSRRTRLCLDGAPLLGAPDHRTRVSDRRRWVRQLQPDACRSGAAARGSGATPSCQAPSAATGGTRPRESSSRPATPGASPSRAARSPTRTSPKTPGRPGASKRSHSDNAERNHPATTESATGTHVSGQSAAHWRRSD